MQVNVTIVSTACTITKRDPTHTPDFNQENHPVLDMGGQGGATTANAYELHCVQVQSGPFFPPYGLPLNYTLLTTVYVPGEKIASFAPVFIENQQPQPNHTHAHASQPMEETHEAPKTTI